MNAVTHGVQTMGRYLFEMKAYVCQDTLQILTLVIFFFEAAPRMNQTAFIFFLVYCHRFHINLSLFLVKCQSTEANYCSLPFILNTKGQGAVPVLPSRLHFLSKSETVAKFMFVPLQVHPTPPPRRHSPPHSLTHSATGSRLPHQASLQATVLRK